MDESPIRPLSYGTSNVSYEYTRSVVPVSCVLYTVKPFFPVEFMPAPVFTKKGEATC